MFKLLRNQHENDFRRSSRIAVIVFGVSVLWVPLLRLVAGPHPAGELAAVAAVPLIVSYLLLRTMGELFTNPDSRANKGSDSVKVEMSLGPMASALFMVATVAFVLGLWTCTVAGFSYLAYKGLAINWAAGGAVLFILATMKIIGFTASAISAFILCHQWIGRIARFSRELVDRPLNAHRVQQH